MVEKYLGDKPSKISKLVEGLIFLLYPKCRHFFDEFSHNFHMGVLFFTEFHKLVEEKNR